MSFHTVKIVRKLKKFKFKKKIKILDQGNAPIPVTIKTPNINLDITTVQKNPSVTTDTINLENNIPIASLLDDNDVIGNHYIGLIFIYSSTLNRLNNMKWGYEDPDVLYINNTSIFIKDNNKFPIFELNSDILNDSFKYKKYIRKLIDEKFNIHKKYIINIKFFETFGNLHNYLVILNNVKCLDNGRSSINIRSRDNLFSWKTQLDFFKLNKSNKYISQQYIFNKILTNQTLKTNSKFSLIPEINESTPKYIKNNEVNYGKLLNTLSNIDFGY